MLVLCAPFAVKNFFFNLPFEKTRNKSYYIIYTCDIFKKIKNSVRLIYTCDKRFVEMNLDKKT